MRQIERVECLVHISSTIALEASYNPTPILQIVFNPPHPYPAWQDLLRVMENDHLRLTLHTDCPNIAESEERLARALGDVLGGRVEAYRPYSERIQRFARPLDVPSFQRLFIGKLKEQLF